MKFTHYPHNITIAVILFIIELMINSGVTYASTVDSDDLNHNEIEENCDQRSSECVEIDEWKFALSAGVGIRSNPLLNGKDIPLFLLPEISYYGENFFIENLEFGYTLIDTPTYMLNLITSPSYDRVFFSRWDLGNIFVDISSLATFDQQPPGITSDNITEINSDELTSRKFSILGGLEYSTQFDNSKLQLSLLTDVTNIHSGTEVRFAFSHNIQMNISTTIGFTWKDKKLTDYYYGLNSNEVVDDRGAYSADSSFNPFIRFSWLLDHSTKNSWRLSVDYQKLDKEIHRSPLVDEDYSITFFIGKRFELN